APLRAWAHRGLRRLLATPPPRHRFRIGAVTLEVSGPRLRLALGALPPLTERRVTVPGRLALPEIGRTLEATLCDADGFVIPDEPGRGGAGRHAHAPGPRAGTRRAGGAARRPVKSWISVVDENATRTPPDCPVHAAGVRRAADAADARPACPAPRPGGGLHHGRRP